jgi:polar amino acid transport system substrate-binding protein
MTVETFMNRAALWLRAISAEKHRIEMIGGGLLVCLMLFALSPCESQAHQKSEFFSINTADQPPFSTASNTGIYDLIITRLINGLGIKFHINHLPSARSIENLDLGIDDAEYARIEGLGWHYPHIRMVGEPLVDFNFTAFTRDAGIALEGWGDLKNYNVAFLKGWKIYEMHVKETKSLLIVASEKEMFNLLVKGRVDVILYERRRGLDYMRRNGIPGVHALQKPLAVRPMYLYLNEKHEKLIPELENGLRVMKASGEYRQILVPFEE